MAKKKKMSRAIPVDEMWEKFEAAIKGETPRGMAMVHGALIEDALMRMLKSYPVAGDATDALLDGFNSPVSTWSARTLLAYSVGLFQKTSGMPSISFEPFGTCSLTQCRPTTTTRPSPRS